MKSIQLIIAACLLYGCASTRVTSGTYQSICMIYDRLPRVTLILNEDKSFSYKFPYVDDKIEGTWNIRKDSLILTSSYFLKESEPLTSIRKYTDVPGDKDIYIIKSKKLYAVSVSGVKKECRLEKVIK